MNIRIRGGTVIIGDGKTILDDASIIVHGELIKDISTKPKIGINDMVIDAEDKIVIPGIINHHEHYVTFGPGLMGDRPWYREQVLEHLNRHILQGTTTILNVDGFVTPEEAAETDRSHPINVKTCTLHNSNFIKAVRPFTGCPGLKTNHLNLSLQESIKRGAVAIGEVEEMTIWGALVYLPHIIMKRTGIWISGPQIRRLQMAMLGDVEHLKDYDIEEIEGLIKEMNLSATITHKEINRIFNKTFILSHKYARKGWMQVAKIAAEMNIPIILHNAYESKDWLLDIAKRYKDKMPIIAAHCDSFTFPDISEAVEHASKLKELGVITNVTTWMPDHVTPTELCLRLYRNELVDTICTDGGGHPESIPFFIEKLINRNATDLVRAVASVTGNVAKAIPCLAPNRGILKPGKIADITLLDEKKVSRVRGVIISGKVILKNGCDAEKWLPERSPPIFAPGGRIPTREFYTKITDNQISFMNV